MGFTDSLYARQIGVNSYGYAPFMLPQEELETMHGHDERLPTEELGRGVRVLFSVLADLAIAPQPRQFDEAGEPAP